MIKIAPSILSADFARLGAEVESIRSAGADYVHYDVMDGEFVPNISIGVPVLKSLRRATDMFIDAHLMIVRPIRYVKVFCDSGADLVNVHVEADTEENIISALKIIRDCGKKAGITLKPGTSAETVLPYIDLADLILVMTVNPGFGGQGFMKQQLTVVERVRKYIDELKPACELEVDGGIDPITAKLAIAAGANVLVSGSTVFGSDDRANMIRKLRG